MFARTLRADEPACLWGITVHPILTDAALSWAWAVPWAAPGLKGFYGSQRRKGEPRGRLLRRMAREQVGQPRHQSQAGYYISMLWQPHPKLPLSLAITPGAWEEGSGAETNIPLVD